MPNPFAASATIARRTAAMAAVRPANAISTGILVVATITTTRTTTTGTGTRWRMRLGV